MAPRLTMLSVSYWPARDCSHDGYTVIHEQMSLWIDVVVLMNLSMWWMNRWVNQWIKDECWWVFLWAGYERGNGCPSRWHRGWRCFPVPIGPLGIVVIMITQKFMNKWANESMRCADECFYEQGMSVGMGAPLDGTEVDDAFRSLLARVGFSLASPESAAHMLDPAQLQAALRERLLLDARCFCLFITCPSSSFMNTD